MSDDDSKTRRAERLIYDAREEAFEIRRMMSRQGAEGYTDPQTKRKLAAAAYEYWDVLFEHRDETILDDGDFPDITPIESRLGERVEVPVDSSRRGGGTRIKSEPAVGQLSREYLIRVTKQLDDCRQKLGFGAKARDATEHDEITHSDLAALLENRGQDEALEKVPGGS